MFNQAGASHSAADTKTYYEALSPNAAFLLEALPISPSTKFIVRSTPIRQNFNVYALQAGEGDVNSEIEPIAKRIEARKPNVFSSIFDPNSDTFRTIVLLLTFLPLVANYFAYDCVAALSSYIKSDFNLNNKEFGLLYTVYEIPNIVMPIIAGVLIDKIGLRLGILIAMVVVLLGVSLTASGPLVHSFTIMLMGRAFYGLGAECIYVGMDVLYAKWFRSKGLALAIGLGTTFGRLGDVMSFNLAPFLAERFHDYKVAMLAGVGFALAGLVSCILYFFMDLKGEKRLQAQTKEQNEAIESSIPSSTDIIPEMEEGHIMDDDSHQSVLARIKTLPPIFWVLAVVCICYYSTYFPLQAFAPGLIEAKYAFTPEVSARITGILSIVSTLLNPVMGYIVDKVDIRAAAVTVAGCVMIPALLLLGFSPIHPAVPIFAIGLAMVMVPPSIWSALALSIPPKQYGLAYGLMTSLFNIGLMSAYFFLGFLIDYFGRADYVVGASLAMVMVVGLSAAIVWLTMTNRTKRAESKAA
eukprot:CAMPEP_0184670198 /NCGR_PEP_ID=MMETSP0308-20130426/81155_1 /TAXON_ID=38269 /ORGANISM="Gloeochaete witrockiana, Strain SAG 46.84" /LENGTH=524 /DNA_ID=CAMNT_0027116849 /DNA_START=121 /DNA_END=1696 /DNA_ORIENTATION=+